MIETPETLMLLRELLDLDPERGLVRWKNPAPRQPADWFSGGPDGRGYLQARIRGQKVLMHRLVFALHHNRWPVGMVDHRDRDRSNNSVRNLRDVTALQNRRNQDDHDRVAWVRHKQNIIPYLGRFKVTVRGRRVGVYDTLEDAVAALEDYRRIDAPPPH